MRNNRLIQINEGEHYLFFNFFKGKEMITLGFPYTTSCRNDVYLGSNGKEKGRISFFQAQKYLTESILSALPLNKLKGISSVNTKNITSNQNGIAKCKICEKKLRGNLLKPFCTQCYNDLGRPEMINIEKFNRLNKTYIETFKLIFREKSIYDIALIKEVKYQTIIKHLEVLNEYIDLSNFPHLWPDEKMLDLVRKSVNELGEDFRLKMLFEYINFDKGQQITYDELRHCLLFKEM